MKYCFRVNISDEDYYKYNNFVALKSPYGNKMLTKCRIIILVVIACCALLLFINNDHPVKENLISIIPELALLAAIEIFLPRLLSLFVKITLKTQKKTGKPAYSASSQMEFYDDCFAETTEDGKTENKYSAVERVSVTDGYIYIHINGLMAYILPKSSFSSDGQYEEFLNFITSKCGTVDKY